MLHECLCQPLLPRRNWAHGTWYNFPVRLSRTVRLLVGGFCCPIFAFGREWQEPLYVLDHVRVRTAPIITCVWFDHCFSWFWTLNYTNKSESESKYSQQSSKIMTTFEKRQKNLCPAYQTKFFQEFSTIWRHLDDSESFGWHSCLPVMERDPMSFQLDSRTVATFETHSAHCNLLVIVSI